MTRKHYEAIAGIIRGNMEFANDVEGHCSNCSERLRNVADELADYFASNKKFNRDRFMKACFGG